MPTPIPETERASLKLALTRACQLADCGYPETGFSLLRNARRRICALSPVTAPWTEKLQRQYEGLMSQYAVRYALTAQQASR